MIFVISNSKLLNSKSYTIIGVLSIILRLGSMGLISYLNLHPNDDLFITEESNSALLQINFVWLACYIALIYRSKHF